MVESMNKLTLAVLTAACILIILPAQATIYVGGEAGLASISEAIEAATENETIIVYEGIYRENVVIDKPLILKAAGNVTVEAADNTKSVVWLKANSVVFSGFSVKGGYVGIRLDNVRNCRIENNTAFGNDFGIAVLSSSSNSIVNNSASENEDRGLQIQYSEENEVWNNILTKNLDGVVLSSSSRNALWNNSASENGNIGLRIEDSEENEVWNNIFSKNSYGIVLISSSRNALRNNSASENGDKSLQIEDSEENEVWNNIFTKNSYGVVLIRSNRNALTANNIVDSKKDQARIEENSTLNTFDCNYWSDYAGEDKNRDGIGDEPYEIEGINQENDYDYHPYKNYGGWLNVVIIPEYWEFYTKKGDIQYFYL